ncbi:MAG: VOC family protein [Gammaproteobacteria bacterium]
MRKFESIKVKPATERGKIAPSKIGHFVVNSTPENYEKMVSWYETVLESEVSYANDFVAFLAYDDEHHRIGIAAVPDLGPQPENVVGLNHIAFGYENLDQLIATFKRLRNQGIETYWPINHGPTISFYYKDPDGNRVELFVDVFQTDEQIEEYFTGGAFQENFMGIIFDPDKLIRDFEAGVPFEELTKRPKLPEGMTGWDMFRP